MNIFSSVIFQIAVMFSYILVGFILCRGNFIPKESGTVFSRLENKIFMPAVVINTFMANCTVENIKEKWIFIVYSTVILVFCIIVGYIVGRLLGKTEYLQKIYRYSISVSNFGFVGTAMVSGIYGANSIELFDYLMFTLPLNMFTYSIGVAWLVPNGGKAFSIKSFINPIFISLFIGALWGLLSLPKFKLLTTLISGAADCMSPIAMILTGFVIGSYNLSSLFRQWQTYIVAGIRLIGLPVVICIVLRLLNTPDEIIIATLCANAMPLGLNTVIIPSAYGENPETGASMALVSQICSVVTIPFLFFAFGYS
ncbi:MAG: AEC family transporter [Ruminococcus sp.]|nr:AEC family transporter [Ruminococcus sp.]